MKHTKKLVAVLDQRDKEQIHVYGSYSETTPVSIWHITSLFTDTFELLFGNALLRCVQEHGEVEIDTTAEAADQEVKDAVERGEYD